MLENKIKTSFLTILMTLLFTKNFAQKSIDSLVLEREKYLQDLKNFVAKKAWKDFENNKVTQIYFTDSSSYLFNANSVVLEKIKESKTNPIKGIEMVKTKRIDNNPFHMETAVESTDSTVLYFQEPIVMFSDFENTRKTISDLEGLQQWACMVVHELFHGYQLQHSVTFKYSNETIHFPGRKLQQLYAEQKWFAESIKQENSLLIALLQEKSKKVLKTELQKYISLREARQKKAEAILPEFGIHEEFYEKIEGSAKYIELKLMENLKNFPENKFLLIKDTAYKKNAYQKFKLIEEPWLYDTDGINYFYSTGYNLFRVLDKLKIQYKSDIFNTNVTPYQLLKNSVMK